jgi:phosphatidate cytidylyltransferase
MTAAVAIPLLLWMIFDASRWVLNSFVLLICYIALREFAAMALHEVRGAAAMVTLGGMIIAMTMSFGDSGLVISGGLVVCLAGILIGTLWTAEDMHESVNQAGQMLLGCLYGGLLLPHFIWVRAIPVDGPSLVFFVLGVTMAGDAGGYFGGRSYGKHPLLPRVSPNKTLEGSASSLAASLAIGWVLNALVVKAFGPLEVLGVAAVMNVLAQLGDLLESMLKRGYDAKDSGWIFPGHGGVLDRTDSLVLPIVFVYYYAMLTTGRWVVA